MNWESPEKRPQGVRQGVDFLRELNLTGQAEVGKRVAIIGGGNVAIDVARSAVRLGAEEVNIIYRRTRAEMPAWEEERVAAEAEGVKITYLSAPQEVLTEEGNVVGLRCIRMELGEPDSSGRRRPIPVPGSEYEIEVDQLIPAIGQTPDLSALEDVAGPQLFPMGNRRSGHRHLCHRPRWGLCRRRPSDGPVDCHRRCCRRTGGGGIHREVSGRSGHGRRPETRVQ